MGCNLLDPNYQPRYPLGKYQRFEFGSISATLQAASFVFANSDRETELGLWGYDRYPDPERLPGMQYGVTGESHRTAPLFRPLFFSWNLRFLDPGVYEDLNAIYQLSRDAVGPVRLFDRRRVYDEPFPRKRAKIGDVTNPNAKSGMVYYFAQFQIRFATWQPLWTGETYSLKITAQEYNPNKPTVPVTEDIAA